MKTFIGTDDNIGPIIVHTATAIITGPSGDDSSSSGGGGSGTVVLRPVVADTELGLAELHEMANSSSTFYTLRLSRLVTSRILSYDAPFSFPSRVCTATVCCSLQYSSEQHVLCCAVLYPDLQLYSPILFFFPCLEDARTTTRTTCE